MSYKLTNSHDGVPRIDVNVDGRLTLEDLAVLVTSSRGSDFLTVYSPDEEQKVSESALKETLKTKSAVMKIVTDELHTSGFITPHYRVGDDVQLDEKVRPAVLEHIKTLWA